MFKKVLLVLTSDVDIVSPSFMCITVPYVLMSVSCGVSTIYDMQNLRIDLGRPISCLDY